MIEKIKRYNEEIKWVVRIALVVMVSIMMFTSRTKVRTDYIGEPSTTQRPSEYYIIILNEQDSLLNIQKDEKINGVDSLSKPDLYRAIADFIESEKKR